jgi:hypothetical protein
MTDKPSSGEFSNAGVIRASASTSEAEEVEESEWCVDEVREIKRGGIEWE